ncbi:MAG TPA: hypothetical protein VNC11_03985 [Gemmatimonadaceae bacterium]|nr:hypothetical protein [Gemmatimonadaceae bacterium]
MKVFILLVVALTACHQPSRVSNIRDEVSDVQPIEYEVYSYLLRAYGITSPARVADSTMKENTLTASNCAVLRKGRYCPVEALADFARKNQQAWRLDSRFAKALNVKVARESPFIEPTCRAPTTVVFSRVGVNPEKTEAVVEIDYRTGKGPAPPCGFSAGDILILRRSGKTWKTETILSFIS